MNNLPVLILEYLIVKAGVYVYSHKHAHRYTYKYLYVHGNPLQYSCLANSMDRGAWWAIVHGIRKSCT